MAKRTKESRVSGIGGVFFKAKDPKILADWYRRHLGVQCEDNVAVFTWKSGNGSKRVGHTIWSIFPSDTTYFGDGPSPFMINYRVRDLDRVLGALREEGVSVESKIEDSPYGRFGWITDPEGNRIELWQPPEEYRAPEKGMPMD
jgi:predicted enzyme related to lactoylglutathione lyase